jgi:hypothetical protein
MDKHSSLLDRFVSVVNTTSGVVLYYDIHITMGRCKMPNLKKLSCEGHPSLFYLSIIEREKKYL